MSKSSHANVLIVNTPHGSHPSHRAVHVHFVSHGCSILLHQVLHSLSPTSFALTTSVCMRAHAFVLSTSEHIHVRMYVMNQHTSPYLDTLSCRMYVCMYVRMYVHMYMHVCDGYDLCVKVQLNKTEGGWIGLHALLLAAVDINQELR